MLALVDCNNFFASCEKAANPRLKDKPVVVLSGNGGIVVARSKEAKALGIKMGAPAFECEALFKKYNVVVACSNFALYGEISRQVMATLKSFGYETQVYSVDEAFLKVGSFSLDEAYEMKREVFRRTKIDVSIGIAPTKTLCKAANYFAKIKPELFGVMLMDNIEQSLQELPIEEVWGIGKQLADRLKRRSIYTAWDLAELSDEFIRKQLSVIGLRLALELRGVNCLGFEEMREPKKSISMARSFKKPLATYEEIAQMLASYTAEVAEELREEKQLAMHLSVWISTNPFGKEEHYENSSSIFLAEPSSFTPELIEKADILLQEIFRPGLIYKKVGVMVSSLASENEVQKDLFVTSGQDLLTKQQRLMRCIDEMNELHGKGSLRFGAQIKS